MIPVSDTAMAAIEYALDGLAARAEATAANVSNAEVPGYRGSRVTFEGELRSALSRGRLDRIDQPRTVLTGAAPDAQGNDVVLEDELVEMVKTNLLQSAMVDAYNFKVALLRTAMRGQ